MAEPLIRVRDVTREYRRPRTSLLRAALRVEALRGVSFEVAPRQRFGIVGESGCGKSTLLRILGGLDSPTSGGVEVGGREIGGLSPRRLGFLRSQVQIVFQDPMGSLDPRMRVRDIVAEPLVGGARARSGDARRRRVAELLDAVGLEADAADRYPHQFSGGQRQRISIARALAPSPRILLADEAVSALDVSVRAQVLNVMTDLVRRFDLTLVFVSHDLSVVRHMCDEVAVMRGGVIVEQGPTERIYTDPQEEYTRDLLAAIPRMPGHGEESSRDGGGGAPGAGEPSTGPGRGLHQETAGPQGAAPTAARDGDVTGFGATPATGETDRRARDGDVTGLGADPGADEAARHQRGGDAEGRRPDADDQETQGGPTAPEDPGGRDA